MSKLYVPEGAWLVCSKGMKKQQLKVTSQSQVTIAGGKLKATIDDGPGGNFVCGAMATAGAIIGAVLGVAFVIGTIVTGGALALGAGIAMVAAAAGGAALGGLASLIPSICGMLLTDWTPYDQNVLTCGVPPLLENSEIPCRLGGRVIILYSEKAADKFSDLTISKTAINVVGIIALSYLLYPAFTAIEATAVISKTTIATFGWGAGLNYLGGIGTTSATAYGIGWGIDKAKEGVYSIIPTGDGHNVKDYVDGFETAPEVIIKNNIINVSLEEDKEIHEHINDIGSATDVGKTTLGDRNSQYFIKKKSTSVRLDDIEEHGPRRTMQSGKIDGAIDGKNPVVTRSIEITSQDFGGRYQELNRQSILVNSQYNPIKQDNISALKTVGKTTALNVLGDNFNKAKITNNGVARGGFYVGLLQDAYRGICNLILKGHAEHLIKANLSEEAMDRDKIKVIAGKD